MQKNDGPLYRGAYHSSGEATYEYLVIGEKYDQYPPPPITKEKGERGRINGEKGREKNSRRGGGAKIWIYRLIYTPVAK